MKKYINPEMKTLNLDTTDICNSSGLLTELFDNRVDPHAEDLNDW